MKNTGAREKMLAGASDLFRRRGVALRLHPGTRARHPHPWR
jgi:hypothetical protein